MIALEKHELPIEKTFHTFEYAGVLKPALTQNGDTVHLFYRVVKHATIQLRHSNIEEYYSR